MLLKQEVLKFEIFSFFFGRLLFMPILWFGWQVISYFSTHENKRQSGKLVCSYSSLKNFLQF